MTDNLFEVFADRHPAKPIFREFPTFAAAERSARRLCRIHGITIDIIRRVQGVRTKINETVATVSLDALDRVWTDLTDDGARLF